MPLCVMRGAEQHYAVWIMRASFGEAWHDVVIFDDCAATEHAPETASAARLALDVGRDDAR